ncbi:hypothetical protein HYW83_01595 [Candidatus Peregrinibacteria bacterium]|nr:hypothetical protein [Candidatus Peregrinibacteria bacterium]
MNQVVEEVATPVDQMRQTKKPAGGGVLSIIRSLAIRFHLSLAPAVAITMTSMPAIAQSPSEERSPEQQRICDEAINSAQSQLKNDDYFTGIHDLQTNLIKKCDGYSSVANIISDIRLLVLLGRINYICYRYNASKQQLSLALDILRDNLKYPYDFGKRCAVPSTTDISFCEQAKLLKQEAEKRLADVTWMQVLEDRKTLISILREADTAESNSQYKHAAVLFGKARDIWFRLNASNYTKTPLLDDLPALSREINSGIDRNERRIGIVRPTPGPTEGPSGDFAAGASMLRDMAIAAAPVIADATMDIIVAVEKITRDSGGGQAGSGQTPATASGNGEIQVHTGATGYLGFPCTDDGIAVQVGGREPLKCTTVGGPACTIPNLPPGKYRVSAHRSGGCKVKDAGPVDTVVEPDKRTRVDFSRRFAH